ncbi:TonB-dependent receptor [Phenylobacterium sp. LjRoot225]|uniref:TonB-dependent receptor n=1 Tax=Phenylobacterium sp. LjRoot225 TaxID=3342285 RepID=UPI003ECE2A18
MRKLLLLSVAPAAILFPGLAYAQVSEQKPVAADDAVAVSDIVVTARRREERLQDVPLSVTALSGSMLEQRGVVSAIDLNTVSPNLRVSQGAQKSLLQMTMRGQSLGNLDANLDPSVGYYVDGIYVAKLSGANAAMVDIERVEVLKGPQGTLFGRNTPGGALVVTSADPHLSDFSGRAQAVYGSDDFRSGELVLNLPLVADKIGLRAAGKVMKSDGWGYNPTRDVGQATDDNWFARIKLRFRPVENVDAVLGYERVEIDELSGPQRLVEVSPALTSYFPLVAPATDKITNYLNTPRFLEYGEYPATSKSTVEMITGRVTVEGDVVSVRAITGYRSTDVEFGLDLDHTPYELMDSTAIYNFKQWSGELQAFGTTLDNRLDFTGGLYYFREIGISAGPTNVRPRVTPTAPGGAYQKYDTDSVSVYGQTVFRFAPRLSLTTGLRYSVDDKFVAASPVNALGKPNQSCALGPAVLPDDSVCYAPFKTSHDAILYLASLEYRPTSDIMLYAKIANGTRSGGTNSRATGNNPASFATFAPEKVMEYEAGLKSEFWDRRLRINLAAFYDDYGPIQRSVTFLDTTTGRLNGRVTSDAHATVKGLEFEAAVTPVRGLTLGTFVGLTDAKYSEFIDAGVDRSGEAFPFTPDYTMGLNASYKMPVGPGDLTISADYFRSAKVISNNSAIRAGTLELLTLPAYDLVNARVSYALDNGLQLAVYGTNLFDRHYDSSASDFSLGVARAAAPPRRIFAEVTYRF